MRQSQVRGRWWLLAASLLGAVLLGGCQTIGGGGGGDDQAARLTGAQILGVVDAINQSEIELSQLGQQRAENQRVKDFAQHMVQAHQQSQTRMNTLQSELGTQPSDSSVSRQVRDQSRQTLSTLRNRSGADFDRAFMRAQIDLHQDALRRLDNRLINSAERPRLKQALQDMRAEIESHLREAQSVRNQLQQGGGGGGGGGG